LPENLLRQKLKPRPLPTTRTNTSKSKKIPRTNSQGIFNNAKEKYQRECRQGKNGGYFGLDLGKQGGAVRLSKLPATHIPNKTQNAPRVKIPAVSKYHIFAIKV
jgi:hypothetical protein